MPVIPQSSKFESQGLNKRPTFFGCGSKDTITIIYLPNEAFSYPSNQSAYRPTYPAKETNDMISNGVKIGTQNDDPVWPKCLACGIMEKFVDGLAKDCSVCLEKYCFKE